MDQIHDWLLDSDPAIRWQVKRDLMDDPVSADEERKRVPREGWGARILELQADDGQWGGGAYTPKWISTTYTLLLLRHFEPDPADSRVRTAVERVRNQVEMRGRPFFDYASEMCITGMTLGLRADFVDDVGEPPQIEHILARQRDDGGWNCQVSSKRSSFNTTLSILEGLLGYERAIGGDDTLAEVRAKAHEYLLERKLMYSLRTGEYINTRWLLMSFPPRWFYDVLRALDYLRAASVEPQTRMEEAVDVIRAKRRRDGTWPLQNRHPGKEHFQMEEGSGKPSRWNTLRVLRVLRWYDQ